MHSIYQLLNGGQKRKSRNIFAVFLENVWHANITTLQKDSKLSGINNVCTYNGITSYVCRYYYRKYVSQQIELNFIDVRNICYSTFICKCYS